MRRFLDENNRLDIEGVQKSVVMHEFGHVLGLTGNGRVNSHECLGAHCLNDGCIMQQRLDGDFREIYLRPAGQKNCADNRRFVPTVSEKETGIFKSQMIKFYQSRGGHFNGGR